MITWITDHIAIGDYDDAKDEDRLAEQDISFVLNVVWGQNIEYREMPCANIPFESSIPQRSKEFIEKHRFTPMPTEGVNPIDLAPWKGELYCDIIDSCVIRAKKILVRCGAGIDRSPTVVYLYLSRMRESKQAYELIKNKRPQSNIHLEWLRTINQQERSS